MPLSLSLWSPWRAPPWPKTPDPAPDRRFEAVYNVNARGVDAGEFTYNFTQTGATYQVAANRRTTGGVRLLVGDDQDYAYSVRGAVAGGALRPSAYRHQGGRRDRVVESRFTADDITTTATPHMGMGDPAATTAQKRGAVDQLTAIAAMITATGEVCNRTIPVYMDGRSRFDFVMRANGNVNVDTPAISRARRSAAASIPPHRRFQRSAGAFDPDLLVRPHFERPLRANPDRDADCGWDRAARCAASDGERDAAAVTWRKGCVRPWRKPGVISQRPAWALAFARVEP